MIVKLFTHTDLDGIGNTILANHAFKEVHVSYCDYTNINEEVMNFLADDGLNYYDLVFITDISVNERVARELDFYNCYDKVILLDHHKTSKWINKYDWALSVEETKGKLTCGTELFYEFLVEKGLLKETKSMAEFVEKVRRWDTFDWKVLNDELAHELNMLLSIVGRGSFVSRFSKNVSLKFDETEQLLLKNEKEAYAKELNSKRKSLIEKKLVVESNGLETFNVGIVFCESYVSNIGNDLADENPQLDFIMLINATKKSLSFRARHDANVDLSEIAKLFGGGGHKFASGASIDESKFNRILDIILEL